MKPQVGRMCQRCGGTSTKQLTNFGMPIRGRFQCFDCRRTWDEVHPEAPDYAVGPRAKATWKWGAGNTAYLTAKGESSIAPRARVYGCDARPRGSRYIWTVAVGGRAVAVCVDTKTAMHLGRLFSEEVRS